MYEQVKASLRSLAVGHDWWRRSALPDLGTATRDLLGELSTRDLLRMRAAADDDRRSPPKVCLKAVDEPPDPLGLAWPLLAAYVASLGGAERDLFGGGPAVAPGDDVRRDLLWMRCVSLVLLDQLTALQVIRPVPAEHFGLAGGVGDADGVGFAFAAIDAAPRDGSWPRSLFAGLAAGGDRLVFAIPMRVPHYPDGYWPVTAAAAFDQAIGWLADGTTNLCRAAEFLAYLARPLKADPWDDRLDLAQSIAVAGGDADRIRHLLRVVPLFRMDAALQVVRSAAPEHEEYLLRLRTARSEAAAVEAAKQPPVAERFVWKPNPPARPEPRTWAAWLRLLPALEAGADGEVDAWVRDPGMPPQAWRRAFDLAESVAGSTGGVPPWYRKLFDVRVGVRGTPLWVLRMRRFLRRGRPVPDPLAAVIRADPSLLRLAYDAAPVRWLDDALASLPLAALLPRTLGRPDLARLIEARVPRDRRLAAGADLRADLADRPRFAAALECALATSLTLGREFVAAAFAARYGGGPGTHFDHLYSTREIPKRGGGTRALAIPSGSLRRVQRAILDHVLTPHPLPDACHGFRRRRSIVTNSAGHCGRPMVVRADIRDCFASTTRGRVRYAMTVATAAAEPFTDRALSRSALALLADLCTYRGALPTGAPTSPAILNVLLAGTDRGLSTVAGRHGLTYTRYADDLVISGPPRARRLLPLVRRMLAEVGYELHPGKTIVMRRGDRQRVTGLVVNGDRPTLPRAERRRLRAAAHHHAAGRPLHWRDGRPMSEAALRGRLALLHMVDPRRAAGLRQQAFG